MSLQSILTFQRSCFTAAACLRDVRVRACICRLLSGSLSSILIPRVTLLHDTIVLVEVYIEKPTYLLAVSAIYQHIYPVDRSASRIIPPSPHLTYQSPWVKHFRGPTPLNSSASHQQRQLSYKEAPSYSLFWSSSSLHV